MNVREAYQQRLAQRRLALERADVVDGRLANARLVAFCLIVAAGLGAWVFDKWSGWWIAAPLIWFVLLVVWHDRVARRLADLRASIAFYERALRRLRNEWAGEGLSGEIYLDADHPFAADLDLFGDASLFQLLCVSTSQLGEHTLADWLRHLPSHDVTQGRQRSIAALKGRVDLREALSVLSARRTEQLASATLAQWARLSPRFDSAESRRWAWLLGTVSAVSVALLIGWGWGPLGPLPFLISLLPVWGLRRWLRRRVDEVTTLVEYPSHQLQLLAQILERIAREAIVAESVSGGAGHLVANVQQALHAIKNLGRLTTLLDAQRNQFFVPFGFILLWREQFALLLEKWRAAHAAEAVQWLQGLAELEALLQLAQFAYEHPDYVVPEFTTDRQVRGVAVAHPLLPQCVPNDVHLDPAQQLLVVSGSNMSGKSTYLRTIGINVVLARLGAPVCAQSLQLSTLALGATLRIQDSIQRGHSRFYAEIRRLKQIVDLASVEPTLFLLDELLQGTNSGDRLHGARGILKGVLAKKAIGVITTHDLALTQVTAELGSAAVNAHFADKFDGGSLEFDYKLRPGVVQTSNALALMKAVGLEVS